MNFNSFRECFDAYFDVMTDGGVKQSSKPGPGRDTVLLPLSCVPVLARDNHGYSYPVFVDTENGHEVLYVVGAPSGWRLEQLFEDYAVFDCGIALDMGQGWFCPNIQEVLDAVRGMGVGA